MSKCACVSHCACVCVGRVNIARISVCVCAAREPAFKAWFSIATQAQVQAKERLFHRENGPDASISLGASTSARIKNFLFFVLPLMLVFSSWAWVILVFTWLEFLMLELMLALLVKTKLKWEPAATKLVTHRSKLNAGNGTDWGLKSPSPPASVTYVTWLVGLSC